LKASFISSIASSSNPCFGFEPLPPALLGGGDNTPPGAPK
jgi:hypothetical protein